MVQESKTNNLLVFDRSFKQIVSFDGKQQDGPSLEIFRQPHFSFEGEKIVWFGGKTCVYIVDLTDLSIFLIDNLIPENEVNPPEPLFTIADLKREKILTCFLFETEHTLVYYEKDREPDLHLLSEIFPKYHQIRCMDLDQQKLFGFLAGLTKKSDKITGKQLRIPTINAFTFNKELRKMAEFELPIKKCSDISCIRVSPKNDDVLYVCTDGPLFVLGFGVRERAFEIVKVVEFKNSGNYLSLLF